MMICPICHHFVAVIFHEFRSKENRAIFEYFHLDEGLASCTTDLPYAEGVERYKREWHEMQSQQTVH